MAKMKLSSRNILKLMKTEIFSLLSIYYSRSVDHTLKNNTWYSNAALYELYVECVNSFVTSEPEKESEESTEIIVQL